MSYKQPLSSGENALEFSARVQVARDLVRVFGRWTESRDGRDPLELCREFQSKLGARVAGKGGNPEVEDYHWRAGREKMGTRIRNSESHLGKGKSSLIKSHCTDMEKQKARHCDSEDCIYLGT